MNKSLHYLFAGLLLAAIGVSTVAAVELNDIHSRLNATLVDEVAQPVTSAEVSQLVRRARQLDKSVSIAGGRHSMGGQQFAQGALHIDMSRLQRILKLDRKLGIVTVQAGIQWPALIEGLLAMQADDPAPWTIVQKQTGADALSIGGALSSNIHGRGLSLEPFVQDVAGFRLVRADGREQSVSRTRNPELFQLVIGGYGLFGVVTEVDIKLQRRVKLRRDVELVALADLPSLVSKRIADGYVYGDLQFKTDEGAVDFLQVGVFSTYKPVPVDTPMLPEQRTLAAEDWRRLFVLAHVNKAGVYKAYSDYYLSTTGQVYWSDTHQLSYYDADFESELQRASPGYPAGSLMISEVYVPLAELQEFMRTVASDFREHDTNLIYGTIRLIRRDDETFLPWARRDMACIVVNLRVTHTEDGLRKAHAEFQLLIDRALERGGSYFLTYHRWARKDQLLRAYPEFVEFLKQKLRYDPEERFQSEWYRYYRTMFGNELRRQ